MKKVIYIVVIIIAIVSVLLINLTTKLDKIKINSEIYLYNFNERIEFENVNIKNYKDLTILKTKEDKLELTSAPIYYKNDNKLLLPKDMAIINYETGQIKKINHFSNIFNQDGDIYIDYYGENRILNKYFLYDGEDTYLFLEKINILFGDREVEIEPMSYVKLKNNKSQMQVYLRESDNYFEVDVIDVNVKAVSDYGYEINLKLDLLKNFNGEQLLIKNINSLSNF